MDPYNEYTDFKEAVITRYFLKKIETDRIITKEAVGESVGYGSIIGRIIRGLFSVNKQETKVNTVPDLNTLMFDKFLDENYKDRFEKLKGDSSSVNLLISEAVDQFLKQRIDENNY